MSFLVEIFKGIGIGELQLACGYSIIDFCGRAIYFEGFSRIVSVEKDKVVFAVKKEIIEISGDLRVDEINGQTAVVSGKIISIAKRRIGDD